MKAGAEDVFSTEAKIRRPAVPCRAETEQRYSKLQHSRLRLEAAVCHV